MPKWGQVWTLAKIASGKCLANSSTLRPARTRGSGQHRLLYISIGYVFAGADDVTGATTGQSAAVRQGNRRAGDIAGDISDQHHIPRRFQPETSRCLASPSLNAHKFDIVTRQAARPCYLSAAGHPGAKRTLQDGKGDDPYGALAHAGAGHIISASASVTQSGILRMATGVPSPVDVPT